MIKAHIKGEAQAICITALMGILATGHDLTGCLCDLVLLQGKPMTKPNTSRSWQNRQRVAPLNPLQEHRKCCGGRLPELYNAAV